MVLAGGVGVIGGLVNLLFYYSIEGAKHLFLGREGDPVEVAEVTVWETDIQSATYRPSSTPANK